MRTLPALAFHPALTLALAGLVALATPSVSLAQDGSGEAAMFARLNELRTREGLPALSRDARLDAAARVHTEEMATRGELLHVSDTTGTPIDRANAAGVTDATDLAENVAMHFTLDDAQASLEASSAHLTNMLGPRATHVGLSAIVTANGIYVTQLFAHLPGAPAAAAAAEVAPEAAVTAPVEAAAAVAPTLPSLPSGPAPSGSVVLPPDPSGVVHVPAPAPGVTGYWICANDARGGRWYYYPVRPGMTGALSPDLSVTGSPPGYGPTCSGAGLPAGSSTYGSSPPPPAYGSSPPPSGYYGPRPGYVTPPPAAGRVLITPWGSVRVETRPRRRR
jgi:uncharacterized protein YkwD